MFIADLPYPRWNKDRKPALAESVERRVGILKQNVQLSELLFAVNDDRRGDLLTCEDQRRYGLEAEIKALNVKSMSLTV